MQNLLYSDQYWWNYGLAKFDASMASFEAKLCWALISSILVRCLHIMQIHVARDMIHYHANQDAGMMMVLYSILETKFRSLHNSPSWLEAWLQTGFVYIFIFLVLIQYLASSEIKILWGTLSVPKVGEQIFNLGMKSVPSLHGGFMWKCTNSFPKLDYNKLLSTD